MFSNFFKPEMQTADGYQKAIAPIREDAIAFYESYNPTDLIQDKKAMDWLESDAGQEALSQLMHDVLSFQDEYTPKKGRLVHGHRHTAIGIDERIRIASENDAQQHDNLSLFPCAFHFGGRLLEPYYNKVVDEVELYDDHSSVSYAVAKEFLQASYLTTMPRRIKDQILSATLGRSTGEGETRLASVSYSADQQQLVGVEGVPRLMVVIAGTYTCPLLIEEVKDRAVVCHDHIHYPGQDALLSAETFTRILFSQFGQKAEDRASQSKILGAAFIGLACPNYGVYQQTFYPELFPEKVFTQEDMGTEGQILDTKKWGDRSWAKNKHLPQKLWEAAQKEMDGAKPQAASLAVVLDFFVGAAGEGKPDQAIKNLKKNYNRLSDQAKESLTTACCYLQHHRKIEDIARNKRLMTITRNGNGYTQLAAKWAHNVLKAG